jgi:hypothetical protein
MIDKINPSAQPRKKSSSTAKVLAVVIIFFLLWFLLASVAGGMEEFLYFFMLMLFPAAISFLLILFSERGPLSLWIVAGVLSVTMAIIGFKLDYVPLISTYCGPECGAGVGVEPFAVSIATILAAIIFSISPLRKHRQFQIAIAFVLMVVVFSFGLPVWVS